MMAITTSRLITLLELELSVNWNFLFLFVLVFRTPRKKLQM